MAFEIHKGMIFVIKILIQNPSGVLDVSQYTIKDLYITKPDNTVLTKLLNFTTDGTDGYVQYTTLGSDLDQGGLYRLQVYLVSGGSKLYSDVYQFRVVDNLV